MSALRWLAAGAVGLLIVCASARARADDDVEYCRVHWWGVGQCWHPVHRRPVLTFGGEVGFAKMEESGPFGFNGGTGSVTQAGPAWGLRLGVDLLSWLGFEARWIGTYNSGNSRAPDVAYLMNGGEFVMRLAIPTPFIRPYIFGGIGGYNFQLVGSDNARAASMLNSSTQPGVPMGVGLELMLSWHVTVAVEATYRFQIGESFSANDNIGGADTTTLTGVIRFRL